MAKERLDVTQVLKNVDGTDASNRAISNEVCKTCGQNMAKLEPLTLGEVLIICLTSNDVDERGQQKVQPKVRFDRYRLAMKIKDNEFISLKSEQITELKNLAGKVLNTFIMGQVWELLDPSEVEDD